MTTYEPTNRTVWCQGKYTGVTVYECYAIAQNDRYGYRYYAHSVKCYGDFEDAKKDFPDLKKKDKIPSKRACWVV